MYFNQQRFVHKKSKQKFHTIYKHISERCVYKVILHTFSLFAAIHLFISSHDEIEDFCSMDKKTGRRYVLRTKIIHHYNFIAKRTANKKRTKSCTFYDLYSISAPLNPLPRISSTSLIPINASLSILFIMLFKIEISLLST